MALVKADRVRETSTTTGTGTYTLAGAEVGFRTFSSGVGNGNTAPYFAVMGSNWEAGIGTVGAGTLARTTVMTSSNANNPVGWTAGTKQVALGIPAGLLPMLQGDNTFTGNLVLQSTTGDIAAEVRTDGDFTPRFTLRKANTGSHTARFWQTRVDSTGNYILRDGTAALDRMIAMVSGHIVPGVNDVQDIGDDTPRRWRHLYLSNGIIIDSEGTPSSVEVSLVSRGDDHTPVLRMRKASISSDEPMEYKLDIDTGGRLRCFNVTTGLGVWMVNSNDDFTPTSDNATLCGSPANRWQAVYAGNGTIQTSDAREKTEVADSELGLEFLTQLRPVSYRRHEEATETRHYGLIAQEVATALAGRRFDGLSYDAEADRWGLNYAELVPVLIKAVQELLQVAISQAPR